MIVSYNNTLLWTIQTNKIIGNLSNGIQENLSYNILQLQILSEQYYKIQDIQLKRTLEIENNSCTKDMRCNFLDSYTFDNANFYSAQLQLTVINTRFYPDMDNNLYLDLLHNIITQTLNIINVASS